MIASAIDTQSIQPSEGRAPGWQAGLPIGSTTPPGPLKYASGSADITARIEGYSQTRGTESQGRLIAKLRGGLPGGQTLPKVAWEKRYRALFLPLCAHAVILPVFGALRGYGAVHRSCTTLRCR